MSKHAPLTVGEDEDALLDWLDEQGIEVVGTVGLETLREIVSDEISRRIAVAPKMLNDLLDALQQWEDSYKDQDDYFKSRYGSAFDTARGMTNEARAKIRR